MRFSEKCIYLFSVERQTPNETETETEKYMKQTLTKEEMQDISVVFAAARSRFAAEKNGNDYNDKSADSIIADFHALESKLFAILSN